MAGDRTGQENRLSRGTGRVRIEDVARLAKVSPQTVSRYFRSPGLVAEATGMVIRDAVLETGYVPNLVAGSLASNRSRVVAIVVPTIANPVHAAPVEGVSDVLRRGGYQVLLGSTGYDSAVEDEVIAAFLGRRVDGLILTGRSIAPETRRLIEAAKIAVVQTWELPDDPIDMAVGFSNAAAGAEVAEHLASRGYRRPLVVAHAAAADTRSVDRTRGFVMAAKRLGMARPRILKLDRTTSASGAKLVERILQASPDFDAVFAVSDQVAIGIVLACQRRGILLPEAFGLVGFGDVEMASLMTPAITTVHVHRYRLGELAGEMLLQRLRGETVEQPVVDIGFDLVVRDSTPARPRDRQPAQRARCASS